MSGSGDGTQKVVGVFESVRFPAFGGSQAVAKLDTGAFTGALHCQTVAEKVTDKGVLLEFVPLDQKDPIQLEEYAISYVKSSNGVRQKRYFIDTTINISGTDYPIVLSLNDRSEMKWQVLIGRRFLRKHGFVVDVRKPSKYLT